MSELADRYLRPREGWLSLALLFVMLLSLGWSLQHAGWLDHSDFLIPIAFYAVIAGALLGLSRLSVVATVSISGLLGAAIVLWTVGGESFPELSQLGRLLALRDEGFTWLRVLVDRGYPPQETPYALAGAALIWATAFISAYTIYRHHRALDAILLVGAALIANMMASLTDLFVYLLLFVLAALLLWLRAALLTREEAWVRRRVTENADVPSAIMRSGILFIAGSITLAWVLTTVAVAAPLTGVWNNLDTVWTDMQDGLADVFGGFSDRATRFEGTSFGPSFKVSGNWTSSDEPVMTVTGGLRGYYMRTRAYDVYTGIGFTQSSTTEREVAAGEPFYPGYTAERPVLEEDALDLVSVAVVLHEGSPGRSLYTPGYPTKATAPVRLVEVGGQSLFASMEATSSVGDNTGYLVTAKISRATEAQLSEAGTAYPPEITATYLDTTGVTDRTRAKAREIVEDAGATNPYEMAKALARWLHLGPEFSYQTSAPVPAADQDLVDFFLFDENGKVGYCQYYATTMAVMARTLGLPSRVAAGYAPGERVGEEEYLVRAGNAHAWAEIYFPGYGWQIFEATKTISGVTRAPGRAGATPPGGERPTLPTGFDERDDEGLSPQNLPSFEPLPDSVRLGEEGAAPEARGGNLLVILAFVVGLLGIVGWRLRRARRTWRFLAPGERQWQRLALAAGRAGVAPRPSETIYEYAGWLEEQIPDRRPEISTIADGKVWQSYSGRGMTGEAIARIERAWSRLQLPLLWLTVKRRAGALLGRH